MKQIALFIIFFYLLVWGVLFSAYADEWNVATGSTLREREENIKNLKQKEKLLQFKWKSYRIGENSLGTLVNQKLSESDKQSIETYVQDFHKTEQRINLDMENALINKNERRVQELENDRLSKKIEFYGKLTPYISKEKLLEYKKYIESDMHLNEQSKTVAVKIQEQRTIQNEKIEYYQEKIQDNREKLREQIESKVTKLVYKRLDSFVSNESFSRLDNEVKIKIFDALLQKFDARMQEIESQKFTTTLSEEKIIIYEVIQDILRDYIDTWK